MKNILLLIILIPGFCFSQTRWDSVRKDFPIYPDDLSKTGWIQWNDRENMDDDISYFERKIKERNDSIRLDTLEHYFINKVYNDVFKVVNNKVTGIDCSNKCYNEIINYLNNRDIKIWSAQYMRDEISLDDLNNLIIGKEDVCLLILIRYSSKFKSGYKIQ